MNFLKKYWPTITAALGAALPFLMPSILAYVQAHPHTAVGVLLAAVIAAYHASAPKDQPTENQQNSLKMLLIFALLFAFAAPSQAQTPTSLYAGGVSYNNAGTPSIAGTALYAHKVDQAGTYAAMVFDALPTQTRPFTVTTNVGTGVVQKFFSIGGVSIYGTTNVALSFNGTNTGWSYAFGGGASIPLKKNSHWRFVPMLRGAKSNVSNRTGFQVIPGGLIGYVR